MRTTDADVLHDNLGGIVPANQDFLVLLKGYDVLVVFFPATVDFGVLKLCVRRFKGTEIQEGVLPALMSELVGKNIFAKLTTGLMVCVEFTVLILTF
jgi:hypothetical protein